MSLSICSLFSVVPEFEDERRITFSPTIDLQTLLQNTSIQENLKRVIFWCFKILKYIYNHPEDLPGLV